MNTEQYFLPESLEEATSLLDEHGSELLVIAGGTVAMPLVNEGLSIPRMVMGLRRSGLDYVSRRNGSVDIGAACTLSRLRELEAVPILAQAAHQIGGWAVRNMATVGGNLFAPPPAGDLAVALLALDSQIVLTSRKGERLIPLEDFYTGFMATDLHPEELVSEIQIPVPKGKTAYLKYGRRHANTPAIATVAVHLIMDGNKVSAARVALNAVGPHPLRSKDAEKALVGSILKPETISLAAKAAAEECQPFSDAVASEWYRRKMVEVILRRVLTELSA